MLTTRCYGCRACTLPKEEDEEKEEKRIQKSQRQDKEEEEKIVQRQEVQTKLRFLMMERIIQQNSVAAKANNTTETQN